MGILTNGITLITVGSANFPAHWKLNEHGAVNGSHSFSNTANFQNLAKCTRYANHFAIVLHAKRKQQNFRQEKNTVIL